jgi:hypothetical protein
MTMSKKIVFQLAFIFQLFFFSSILKSQDTFVKLNLGYGIWESFHGGFDLRFKDYSIGIDLGTSFKTEPFNDKYFSITLENTFYLGNRKNQSLKTWYISTRLIYWNLFEPNSTWRVLQICPTFGKEFSINKALGLNLDIGPAILLHANRTYFTEEKVGWIYPIYPEFRIEIFYRFL